VFSFVYSRFQGISPWSNRPEIATIIFISLELFMKTDQFKEILPWKNIFMLYNSKCYERRLLLLFQLHLPIKRYQHSNVQFPNTLHTVTTAAIFWMNFCHFRTLLACYIWKSPPLIRYAVPFFTFAASVLNVPSIQKLFTFWEPFCR